MKKMFIFIMLIIFIAINANILSQSRIENYNFDFSLIESTTTTILTKDSNTVKPVIILSDKDYITKYVNLFSYKKILPLGKCSEWFLLALEVGWQYDRLSKLGDIIYSESSCRHDVDRKNADWGLLQINWAAHGERLESIGISKQDLLNPKINLEQGLVIANYAEEHYGCWAQPWYMSGDWC